MTWTDRELCAPSLATPLCSTIDRFAQLRARGGLTTTSTQPASRHRVASRHRRVRSARRRSSCPATRSGSITDRPSPSGSVRSRRTRRGGSDCAKPERLGDRFGHRDARAQPTRGECASRRSRARCLRRAGRGARPSDVTSAGVGLLERDREEEPAARRRCRSRPRSGRRAARRACARS